MKRIRLNESIRWLSILTAAALLAGCGGDDKKTKTKTAAKKTGKEFNTPTAGGGAASSVRDSGIFGALNRGKLTAVASNGRQIHLATFAAIVDGMDGASWPSSDKFKSSEEFFVKLMESGTLNVSYKFFTGPGVQAATSKEDFLKGGHNIWCVVADLNDGSPGDLPLLFTKNLMINKLDDPSLYDPTGGKSKQLKKVAPFGEKGFVVIAKSGATFTMNGPKLLCGTEENPGEFRKLFNVLEMDYGEGDKEDPKPANNVVLRPMNEEAPLY